MSKEKFWSVSKMVFPYICIVVAVLLIKAFIFGTIRVNGESMLSTLHHGDIMILDKISYRFTKIDRFDIVVINAEKEDLIKRVIGLPGEHIAYKNNELYINGKKVKDNHSEFETEDFVLEEFGYDKIPEGMYFVLGDNRVNSIDSRILGLISEKDIEGHATFTLFPFTHFGFKK